ncbi:MAG: SAM-dependent methyltransferase [Nocardioides sp.]|nr:SAM-dependent methyltransferase [Nocardioides sp.]
MSDVDRALSFGSDAATYHRYRPGYPDVVADLAIAHADGPVTRALEIGAGTGKATVLFARRGLDVVAVEPDAGMRAVLTEQVAGLGVRVVGASLETLDLAEVGPVDLLYAAAAFHWTDPATRWARAAAALRPGGALAVFGTARDLADPDLRREVEALTAGVLPEGFSGGWTVDEVRAQPGFTAVDETVVERRATMAADDYAAHLTTVSAWRVLPPAEHDRLLARVRAVLPDVVEVTEDVPLHLARRC